MSKSINHKDDSSSPLERLGEAFIVLLRGINVSGKNKLQMADLRGLLNDLGFQKVQTYIPSGNIILQSNKFNTEISQIIKEGINNTFGYDVPVIARTIPEWKSTIEHYPFSLENEKIVAFTFLDKKTEIQNFDFKNLGEDQFKIFNDVVYIYCPNGFGKSKITNNLFERKLKVTATTRNLRTTLKLLELAKNINE